MFKQLRLFALLILPLALIGVMMPADAQKKVGIEIRIEVSEVKTGSFPVPANLIERKN